MLEQRVGKTVKPVAVFLQDRDDFVVELLDDAPDLIVDELLRPL